MNRQSLVDRGRRLEYVTVGWNILEGVVAVASGVSAGSISLVGFGIDSFIEVISGGALLWRMSGDDDERERREVRALRIVGACFLGLAPLLSRAKRRVASGLGSGAMHADARQTEFCTYLSAILLGGLVLNAAFGFWWADPAAGLVMAPIIAREGLAAVRGEACAD